MTEKFTSKKDFDVFGFIFLFLISTLISLAPVEAASLTLEVDTTLDSNEIVYQQCTAATDDCSLRGAISRANADLGNAYVIELEKETYKLTLTGANEDENTTGDLDLWGQITLVGESGGGTVIHGNSLDRILDIKNGGVVTMEDLLIYRGFVGVNENGGGLINAGTVKIDSVWFLENKTSDGADGPDAVGSDSESINGTDGLSGGAGGAIYNMNEMTIFYSFFSKNLTGNGGDGGDGAIYNGVPGDGGAGGNGGDGGAIYNTGSLAISYSYFSSNKTGNGGVTGEPAMAERTGSFGTSGNGGNGGVIYNVGSSLVIKGCEFESNYTGRGGNGHNYIRALYNYEPPTNGGNGGNGVVIDNQIQAVFVVLDSTFDKNRSDSGGTGGLGGTFIFFGSEITLKDAHDGVKGDGPIRMLWDR